MKVLECNIVIGSYQFDFVNELEITSSWEELTSKGYISMPSKLRFNNDYKNLRSKIKRGDQVEIYIGYQDASYLIFKGYVSGIKPTIPIIIEVEDEMWKLKQISISDTAQDESLKSFLQRNIPGIEIDAVDVVLPKFICNKISAAALLESLKQDFSLYSFFRNGILTIGKQYDPSFSNREKLKFFYNIIEDDLEYRTKVDIKIKVTAISNNDDGSKTEIFVGDSFGEERTLNFYNLSKEELKLAAERDYNKLLYDGYRGTITCFGEPFFRMGDIAELENEEETDKTGSYFIDGISYRFGVNGFRQILTLGPRA